jgi:hypothetical protein
MVNMDNLSHKKLQRVQNLIPMMSGLELTQLLQESHILLQKVLNQPHGSRPRVIKISCNRMEVNPSPKLNLMP